ncbi:MAG: calcium/sodium antiporter [bacterium]|nr:calcium/sodium antiporter [bacterium]
MEWLLEAGALILGFALLAKGADGLVDGGASLAEKWGVSPMLVGLTIVAWGTSMPEVVVSGIAAYEGKPGMALGNVLGSNVANIGLVLGTCALILPGVLLGRIALRELVWLLGSLAFLWFVCFDRAVTRTESGLLLAAFALYNIVLFREPRSSDDAAIEDHESKHPWAAVLAGSVAIFLGARLVMYGGEGIAQRVGIPNTVIGLTVFALGTSLPELAAGVTSALRGHTEIGLGNVIGSNVFNSLAVIGVAGLVRPFGGSPAVQEELGSALGRDFPVALGFSLVLLALPFFLRGERGRAKGGFLLAGYLVYITLLFAA